MPRATKVIPAGYVCVTNNGETYIQPDDFVDKGKRIFYIECEDLTVQVNSNLDAAMRVWVLVGQPKVFSVGTVG